MYLYLFDGNNKKADPMVIVTGQKFGRPHTELTTTPVVQRLDNAIHRINPSQVDSLVLLLNETILSTKHNNSFTFKLLCYCSIQNSTVE